MIIASPLFLWGSKEGQAAYAAIADELRCQPHTRLACIIFAAKHVEHSGFLKHLPTVLVNPNAAIRSDDGVQRLAAALYQFPEWM